MKIELKQKNDSPTIQEMRQLQPGTGYLCPDKNRLDSADPFVAHVKLADGTIGTIHVPGEILHPNAIRFFTCDFSPICKPTRIVERWLATPEAIKRFREEEDLQRIILAVKETNPIVEELHQLNQETGYLYFDQYTKNFKVQIKLGDERIVEATVPKEIMTKNLNGSNSALTDFDSSDEHQRFLNQNLKLVEDWLINSRDAAQAVKEIVRCQRNYPYGYPGFSHRM